MPESPHRARFPILAPPRPTTVHEVASASDKGRRQKRNEDAVAVFALSLPQDEVDIVVLSVADGLAEHARGHGTSAVAVEVFGDALSGMIGGLAIGPRWQYGLAEVLESALAETNGRIQGLPRNEKGQPAATTLTAAILIGPWLCTMHVGNSRVYRFSKDELEQLTEDHAREPLALLTPVRQDMSTINESGRMASALGVSDTTTPSIVFRRIAEGDVVLVCSDGLHELVDGDELAKLLSSGGPLDQVAASLIDAANLRGGDDNISVCLARVGKVSATLPEPDNRGERLYGDVAATILPRYQVEKGPTWLPDRIALVAGFLLSVVALAGFVFWDQYRTVRAERDSTATSVQVASNAVVVGDTSWRNGPGPTTGQPAAPPVVTPAAPAPSPVDTSTTVARDIPPPAPAPAPVSAPVTSPRDTVAPAAATKPVAAKPIPSASAAESSAAIAALHREASKSRARLRADSIANEQRRLDAERIANEERAAQERKDSIALATAAAARAEEQHNRDLAAAAERRRQDSIATAQRLETQARAAEQAQKQADALREQRITAGKEALHGWMQRVVNAVSAGDSRAAVLASGPPSFAEFVADNKPKISDATMTSLEVDESSGEGTAAWVLKWKTNFGTSQQRRMTAVATVVREGETWKVLGWK